MRPMQSTPAASPHAVLFIVFFLQGFNFASEVPIGIHQATELHESAHYGNVHLDRELRRTLESMATPLLGEA